MTWVRSALLGACLALPITAFGQTQPATAFMNVNVLTLESDHVLSDAVVVVAGDRIAAVGSRVDVAVPAGAAIVDGHGRFLVPGLTDSHVHLTEDMPWAAVRPDFGDAPLYLAYGVTSVVNLRGTPAQLAWRDRINAGRLLAPTIYTAGEFINEPRVITPEDVRRELELQRRAGYDVVKYHELESTTAGLSIASYRELVDTARRLGLPLVGHAPRNLGVDAMLEARQPLAHAGMLTTLYFRPVPASLLMGVATLAVLALLVVSAFVARGARAPLVAAIAATLPTTAATVAVLPGAPYAQSDALRAVVAIGSGVLAAVALYVVRAEIARQRKVKASLFGRGRSPLGACASVGLAICFAAYWTPLVLRSTTSAIDRFASRLREAGVAVQTTLVVYDLMTTATLVPLFDDEAIPYLRSETRKMWAALPRRGAPLTHINAFTCRVVGRLHRAGVTLIAGTDAMGMSLIPPGSSLHRELRLLQRCGLTPYETLRTATVNAAAHLGKHDEFGTIARGKRADLLLVERNPLDDLSTLRRPSGVMARGVWLPRERLDAMLQRLRAE